MTAAPPMPFKKLFAGSMLAYLAVLPISDTIALRNLLLFLLSCYLAYALLWRRDRLVTPWPVAWRMLPYSWFAWAVFLMLFPLWAAQAEPAWRNLGGQWGESLLAWGIGFGAVWLLGRRGPGLLALAWASAFPIVVHLALVLAAWLGLLGHSLAGDMPMPALWAALCESIATGSWGWTDFPWGFRGLEPMHGNLGYTACQAIALFAVSSLGAWRAHRMARLWQAGLGIAMCFLSILIANSRGALLFGILMLAFAAWWVFRLLQADRRVARRSGATAQRWIRVGWAALVLALAGLVGTVAVQVIHKDPRWHLMADRVAVGLMAEQPTEFLCNGVSAKMEAEIRQRFADRGADYADALIYGLKIQDGGRIMLMRAGVHLMLAQPWGLDGSRTSYQKLMEAQCGHAPVLHFAHAHQGWIDTSLALGWPGILIMAVLLGGLLRAGWRALPDESSRSWGLALLLISGFWILRGFADSVYREHFLQMQALLLAYLFMRLKLARAERSAIYPS